VGINKLHTESFNLIEPTAGARFTTLFCVFDEVSLDSVTALYPNRDQERESQTRQLPGSRNGGTAGDSPCT
jgi:hypothetical protein